ncbi:hypothetical protein Glove_212g246 [Diversispora epigaea]|uniref:Serine-threonine/tyrosine-protein kinase catalytic domain-containing protein n=1 Tax=Diversispora epigaea TaxID=1348612 RepID=A0A397IIA4_9GLOM|nr:hypothetical protein Glove_212g246 [Diversispora epigaea]
MTDFCLECNQKHNDIKQITKGGYGTNYYAKWDGSIGDWDIENQTRSGIKKFNDVVDINEDFLNEMAIHLRASDDERLLALFYGITKDPETREYMMVLEYFEGGTNEFTKIHKLDIVHPPEVLNGGECTKAFVAYELITGLPPYHNASHDKDLAFKICNGFRPKIPFHTPKLITQIIMRCLDARITHRPTFSELFKQLDKYYQAEEFSKNQTTTDTTTTTPTNYKTVDFSIFQIFICIYYNSNNNNNEITIQIKETEEFSKNQTTTDTTITTSTN